MVAPGSTQSNPMLDNFKINAHRDGTSGGHGITYEIRCCLFFTIHSYIENNEKFFLRYQVNEGESGKFDDILFFDGDKFHFFQLKHKENPEKKRLTSSHLFDATLNGDYNILKYVMSIHGYIKPNFQNIKATLLTNTYFDFDTSQKPDTINLEKVTKNVTNGLKEVVLHKTNPTVKFPTIKINGESASCFSNIEYYKFEDAAFLDILKCQIKTEEEPFKIHFQEAKKKYDKHTITQERQIKLNKLYQQLTEDLKKPNEQQEQADKERKKSIDIQKRRISKIEKKMEKSSEYKKHQAQLKDKYSIVNLEQKMLESQKKITELYKFLDHTEKTKQLYDDLIENRVDIENALKYISYAVKAPNFLRVEKIIKEQLKDYFQLENVEAEYGILQNLFINWCDDKIEIHDKQKNKHVIEFDDIETVLQVNIKNTSFNVKCPDELFMGREKELNDMRDILKQNHELIISQRDTISKTLPTGKSNLVKEFIKRHGKEYFYGRIIWIDAKSNNTVTKSFKNLAKQLDIKGKETKEIEEIIRDVFHYFRKLKVLFVFEKYDTNVTLVDYCRTIPTCDERHPPYFIYTSKNNKCLSKPVIEVNQFTEEEAKKFRELDEKKLSDEKKDKLKARLLRFPIHLKQQREEIKEVIKEQKS